MTTFQRARSDEQREVRRRAILDTAAEMLTELPVSQLTLNELARRVGLAKSNVLRYFESREAVLLELLEAAVDELLTALARELPDRVTPELALDERIDLASVTLVAALVARPVLCDLASAQAAVLERNVSAPVVARYKRAAIDQAAALAGLVLVAIPELGPGRAQQFAATAALVTGAVWTHSQPSPALLAVYDADPELAAIRLDFASSLQSLFVVMLVGLLGRPAR